MKQDKLTTSKDDQKCFHSTTTGTSHCAMYGVVACIVVEQFRCLGPEYQIHLSLKRADLKV